MLLLASALIAVGVAAGPAAAEDPAVAWTQQAEAGVVAAQTGDLAGAERAFRAAYALADRLPPDDARRATAAHNLGFALYSLGQPEAALPYYREALQIRERIFGRSQPLTAQSLSALGEALRAVGQPAAAEDAHLRALEIRRTRLPPGHPELAESLNAYGVLLIDRGRLDEAEAALREALDIRLRVLGERQLPVAETRAHLGALAYARGRYAEAEAWYRQGLQVEEAVYGESSAALVGSLANLGLVIEAQGRRAEAARVLERAAGLLGDTAPPLAAAQLRARLGAMLAQAGERERAREELERSLAAMEQALGRGAPALAEPLMMLAGVERDTNPDRALALLRRAVTLGETAGTDAGQHLAAAMHNLAMVEIDRGRLDEADRLLERTAAIEGQRPSDLARTLARRADLLTALGRDADADALKAFSRGMTRGRADEPASGPQPGLRPGPLPRW